MRAVRCLPALGAVLVVALGCTTRTIRWYDENPRLDVRVWGGFAEDPLPPRKPQRIEVLLDGSEAMQTPTPAGPSRAMVARTAAGRFVAEMPESATVRVSGVGLGGRCEPPRPIGRSAVGESRVALAASLAGLQTGGQGSIAQAISQLADTVRTHGEPTRVVAFTDLNDEPCGVDLCSALSKLEASGASLDLVVIGDAAIPNCVAAAGGSSDPAALPPTLGERHPTFRVVLAAGGAILAEGVVGDPPIEVIPEMVFVVVDLDPPLRVGPIRLTPDAITRLEILEFPHRRPRVREWRWEAHLMVGEPETP